MWAEPHGDRRPALPECEGRAQTSTLFTCRDEQVALLTRAGVCLRKGFAQLYRKRDFCVLRSTESRFSCCPSS